MSGDGRRRTRLSAARESVYERIEPHGRTETVPVGAADGRVAAKSVVAPTAVPETARAAVGGYAVRAADTFGADDRSPAVLRVAESVERETATRVVADEPLPTAADAVVPADAIDRLGDELEVFEAVPENGNVTPAGSVVTADEQLLAAGEQIRPTTLGLLDAAGVDRVTIADRPVVVVLGVGDAPGAGLAATVARRWGARSVVRGIESSRRPLRTAIDDATDEQSETADVIHVVGRTGEDREIGRRLARRLAVAPGEKTSLAIADGRPVVTSPADPVATLVAAVGLVRPAIRTLDGRPATAPPGRKARLSRKLRSAPGVRTFVPVTVTEHAPAEEHQTNTNEPDGRATNADEADGRAAGADETDGRATNADKADGRAASRGDEAGGDGKRRSRRDRRRRSRNAGTETGSGVSAVASPLEATGEATAFHASRADGWVAVPESREGIDAGTVVMVRNWEVGA